MCKKSDKTSTTTTAMPAWLDSASQYLLGKAKTLSDKPFEAYGGKMVADMTPDQQSAFQRIRDMIARSSGGGGIAIPAGGAPSSGAVPGAQSGAPANMGAPIDGGGGKLSYAMGAPVGGDQVVGDFGPGGSTVPSGTGGVPEGMGAAPSSSGGGGGSGGASDFGDETLNWIRQFATSQGQQVDPRQTATERVVDESGKLGKIGDYFNPYVDQALQPALRKIQESSDAARKRVAAGATSAGAFGDARHGILESELDRSTSQATGDTASKFYKDAFDSAMGLRTGDLNRFTGVDEANAGRGTVADMANANFNEQAIQRLLTGAKGGQDVAAADQARMLSQIQALLAGGTMQQGNDQAGLDAMYKEFMRGYGDDFAKLEALRSAVGGVPHGQTSTTVGTQPDNSILGGLGAGAGAFLGSQGGSALVASLLAGI